MLKNTHTNKKIIFGVFILFIILSQTPIAEAQSLKDTLYGANKTCKFVEKGLYMPFSNVNGNFPVFGKLIKDDCILVAHSVENMFARGFEVFLGLVSLIAVINISYAGIQWMMQDKSAADKTGAKKILTNSVVGLILALSSWAILSTVNKKLITFSFDPTNNKLGGYIAQDAIRVANITPTAGGNTATIGSGGTAAGGGTSVGSAVGTGDATGAITPSDDPTIFGYRDGNGYAGKKGDNGLGSGYTGQDGWRYYNGGAHNPSGNPALYSQGVALPQATVERDFGGASNVKNGAYEIFVEGVSKGAFPVLDVSLSKLDLSYGLVKNHIDSTVTSSNSWSGAGRNITYKPLPNYWLDHPRPAQPMVQGGYSSNNPNASEVDSRATNQNTFKIQ